ncbi:MAG: RluA family pseudouridine synthase [Bacilli bacterium]|nr:RluA family pseudouridine synthase [Bacilli bacterium]
MNFKYQVEKDSIVKRYILEKGISRNLGRKIKLYGEIYINGKRAENYFPLKKGDLLMITLPENQNPEILPVEKAIEVVYEDEELLIINKQSNLSTQPSKKHRDDNLIGRIKYYYQEAGIKTNTHVVTRLDYATTGLVLVAKNGFMHHRLSEIAIEKTYLAKVVGILEEKTGLIDAPIKRLEGDRLRRQTSLDGKPALTAFQVLSEEKGFSLLELVIKTGRCHQIRVHLASINHPIVGDKLYGEGGEILHLHASRLKFVHPTNQALIEVKSKPEWL